MNQRFAEVWAIVTADKKKTGVLACLVLVAVGLWLRAALTSGPSRAGASTSATDASGFASNKTAGKNKGPAEADAAPPKTVRFTTPEPLRRDMFALSDPLVALSAQPDLLVPDDPKSRAGTDDKSARAGGPEPVSIVSRVRQEAESLRLRSTMVGTNPIAVIEPNSGARRNAAVLRVGDMIDGFTLVEVHAHSVVMEKDGVRVTLSRAGQ